MTATIPQIELALKGKVAWAEMTSPFGRKTRSGKPGAPARMIGEGLPQEDRRRAVARSMRLFAMTHNKVREAGS